jgi:hypothetical protein
MVKMIDEVGFEKPGVRVQVSHDIVDPRVCYRIAGELPIHATTLHVVDDTAYPCSSFGHVSQGALAYDRSVLDVSALKEAVQFLTDF